MATTQAAPALRPMTIADLFDETIKIYRRNFGQLIALSAVMDSPLLVFFLLAGSAGATGAFQVRPGQPPNTTAFAALFGAMGITFLVALLIFPVGVSAMIHAVSEARLGRRLGVGEALRLGLRRYWALTGLMFVYFTVVAVLWITLIGMPVAIYFMVAWGLSYATLLLEGAGVFGSLSRSRALVRGMWWRTFGIAILFWLFQSIAAWIITLPVSIVAAALGAILARPGLAQPAIAVVNALANILGQIVPMPILYTGWVLYYYDLRIRKEGLDLELRAQQMETAPPLIREPEPGG